MRVPALYFAWEEPLASEPKGVYIHDDGRPVLGRKLKGKSRREMASLGLVALSARLAADHLGHSRPSMTQDVHLARRPVDSQAVLALEAASRDIAAADGSNGKTMAKEEGQTP